jgi:hypothetical protein
MRVTAPFAPHSRFRLGRVQHSRNPAREIRRNQMRNDSPPRPERYRPISACRNELHQTAAMNRPNGLRRIGDFSYFRENSSACAITVPRLTTDQATSHQATFLYQKPPHVMRSRYKNNIPRTSSRQTTCLAVQRTEKPSSPRRPFPCTALRRGLPATAPGDLEWEHHFNPMASRLCFRNILAAWPAEKT